MAKREEFPVEKPKTELHPQETIVKDILSKIKARAPLAPAQASKVEVPSFLDNGPVAVKRVESKAKTKTVPKRPIVVKSTDEAAAVSDLDKKKQELIQKINSMSSIDQL